MFEGIMDFIKDAPPVMEAAISDFNLLHLGASLHGKLKEIATIP